MTTPQDVVFITGASSGIGQAVARTFVRKGARVVGTGRRRKRLDDLANELGENFWPVELDITDVEAATTKVAAIPAEFSDTSILVNSAGLARGLDRAQNALWDDAAAMIDTNIRGTVAITSLLLPGMVARGRGHVINLGSVAADTPYAGGNVYGGTKAFIRQWSLNLKADLLGTPVRVTCIEPGMVRSEYLEVRFRGDRERAASLYESVDYLTVDDIASLIVAITSLPPRVNVTLLQVMPTEQAHAGYAFASSVQLHPAPDPE